MKQPAAAALLLSVLVAGCGESAPAGPAPGGPPSSNVTIVAEATNRFAFNLYGQLKGDGGNLFFSPQSISTALAMAYCGARGETARQMAAVLGYPPDRLAQPQWIHAANAALLADLRAAQGPDCELAIANALWGQKGHGFLPAYLGLLSKNYGAGLQEVHFAGNAEGARREINAWVERGTREKIKDLIPPGLLTGETRLVLVNAVYFKGRWARPFRKEATADADFLPAAGKKVPVPMMNQEGDFRYAEADDCQVLEMPYKGAGLAMILLLPRRTDGLADLEKGLSAETLGRHLANLRTQKVRVTVPKFKTTSAFRMRSVLSALGMPLAFEAGQADFSGADGGKKPLWIAEVVHKAYVDVYEEGTEAAAATAAIGMADGGALFRADHPFLFLIREKKSGCILFMGRLVDPKQ